MAAALISSGFSVWDLQILHGDDLAMGNASLDEFRGVVFPGGFSYADVLGSAKGWAASILFNEVIQKQFKQFFARSDIFSLGVCNGCQLMGLLGWVGTPTDVSTQPDVFLDHNKSERFECRWSTVKIETSDAIMLAGMEGSVMGVWVAHGEGRFTFKNDEVLQEFNKNFVALRYVDDDYVSTEKYPYNPNGSSYGIAGVCSKDGRHLAMMPHPERCVKTFQCSFIPSQWSLHTKSPWEKMFNNAYNWCIKN